MCSNNHVMMVYQYDSATEPTPVMLGKIEGMRSLGERIGIFKGRCSHCGSTTIRCEDYDTPHDAMNGEFQQWLVEKVKSWSYGGKASL